MSGCGSANCGCGPGCQCSAGCGCCKTLAEPTFGGLRNYNSENDCKCGPNCNCADCDCHK
ncbi:hypothetical protein M758_2G181900 [Ceratodon purpureus]|nr:hypothetical protein M758_2G181900 [Ceratodon purpureus]